eukprot:GHVN01007922.1.p1 GENE.GHVN01007922.1~~GHVN01007922.1.p1  ORF type:complete len:988 (+),score=266.28 GHVN01007922.1:444-2966(+)
MGQHSSSGEVMAGDYTSPKAKQGPSAQSVPVTSEPSFTSITSHTPTPLPSITPRSPLSPFTISPLTHLSSSSLDVHVKQRHLTNTPTCPITFDVALEIVYGIPGWALTPKANFQRPHSPNSLHSPHSPHSAHSPEPSQTQLNCCKFKTEKERRYLLSLIHHSTEGRSLHSPHSQTACSVCGGGGAYIPCAGHRFFCQRQWGFCNNTGTVEVPDCGCCHQWYHLACAFIASSHPKLITDCQTREFVSTKSEVRDTMCDVGIGSYEIARPDGQWMMCSGDDSPQLCVVWGDRFVMCGVCCQRYAAGASQYGTNAEEALQSDNHNVNAVKRVSVTLSESVIDLAYKVNERCTEGHWASMLSYVIAQTRQAVVVRTPIEVSHLMWEGGEGDESSDDVGIAPLTKYEFRRLIDTLDDPLLASLVALKPSATDKAFQPPLTSSNSLTLSDSLTSPDPLTSLELIHPEVGALITRWGNLRVGRRSGVDSAPINKIKTKSLKERKVVAVPEMNEVVDGQSVVVGNIREVKGGDDGTQYSDDGFDVEPFNQEKMFDRTGNTITQGEETHKEQTALRPATNRVDKMGSPTHPTGRHPPSTHSAIRCGTITILRVGQIEGYGGGTGTTAMPIGYAAVRKFWCPLVVVSRLSTIETLARRLSLACCSYSTSLAHLSSDSLKGVRQTPAGLIAQQVIEFALMQHHLTPEPSVSIVGVRARASFLCTIDKGESVINHRQQQQAGDGTTHQGPGAIEPRCGVALVPTPTVTSFVDLITSLLAFIHAFSSKEPIKTVVRGEERGEGRGEMKGEKRGEIQGEAGWMAGLGGHIQPSRLVAVHTPRHSLTFQTTRSRE